MLMGYFSSIGNDTSVDTGFRIEDSSGSKVLTDCEKKGLRCIHHF